MTTAQGILILGGLTHFTISMLAAYFLYWARLSKPEEPAQRYGLMTHKVSLWNGFLLICLSVAIVHTIFTEQINALLAGLILISTLLSDLSNIRRWIVNMQDQFQEGPEWRVRAIGLVHMFDLAVIVAILYGVARSFFGI